MIFGIKHVKVYFLLLICSGWSMHALQSQEFLVNDSNGRLSILDINGCSDKQIANIGSFTDIAAHPNGKFYAIRPSGELFSVDLINIGVFQVAKFQGNNFFALTAGADGTIYAATGGGALASYNPYTDEIKTYPPVGAGASGDLTFYKGQLYLATTNNTLISVHPEDPSLNEVFIDFSSANAEIFGIVSTVVGCEIKTYAISGDNRARIFEIGWEDKTFIQVCTADIRIYGGSSEFEYKASEDGLYIDQFSKTNTKCEEANVTVKLNGKGYGDEIEYSLDGINYQKDNVFDSLGFGKQIIYLRDELGCNGIDSIDLKPGNLELTLGEIIAKTCGENNGSVEIIISSEADSVFLNINGSDFSPSTIIENLGVGDYIIKIKDTDGCLDSVNFEIPEIPIPEIFSMDIEPATCGENNGKLAINFSSENASFSLNNEINTVGKFHDLIPMVYELTIVDENNCTTKTSISIPDDQNCNLYIPNIFSPNDDGINDIFYVQTDFPKEIFEFRIFDRWGSRVFESLNFTTGSDSNGWDGNINGVKAKEGIYIYTLKLKGVNRNLFFSGDINLKR